jgi:hypothetical protein
VKADRVQRHAVTLPGVALLLAALVVLPGTAMSGVKVAETEGFSLELGMRLQPRLEYYRLANDWNRDFMIRRARLKANGKMLDATYGFEWKIDGTDQNLATAAGQQAAVENAWMSYPLGRGVEIKAGLYDQPFSRDRLVSDSRQLAVDRGDVSNVPDAFGLADNATGFEFLGKAKGGKIYWQAGLFDNRRIAGRFQDQPMVVGRLDLNFGSTSDVYQDAHFGTSKWYSLGVNGSYQPLEGVSGSDSLTLSAAGIDGMLDIPTRMGRLFVRGEASTVISDPAGAGSSIDTRQFMAGAGLLILNERLQPFIRFDEVRRDNGPTTDITYVGLNLYRRGHSLKFQGDLKFEANTDESLDGGRIQAQLDF